MTIKVEISTETGGLRMTRQEVPNGKVFRLIKTNGRPGRKRFGALGHNGRFFSINLDSGALAASEGKSATRQVEVVGTFHYALDRYPNAENDPNQVKTRKDVKPGEVFNVTGDTHKSAYLHLDHLNNGKWMSLNIGTDDYALTDNGDSKVVVIGRTRIVASVLG